MHGFEEASPLRPNLRHLRRGPGVPSCRILLELLRYLIRAVYCGFYCGFGSGSGVHCVHFGMIYGPNYGASQQWDRAVFVSLRACNGSDSSCGLCVVLVCARVRYTTYSCSSY